jgi:hypothetical protein
MKRKRMKKQNHKYKKKTLKQKQNYNKKTRLRKSNIRKTKRKRIVKIKEGTKKYNKSIIKINGINCAPKKPNEINDYSCYSKDSLFELRDLWNARHQDVKIKSNKPRVIHSKLKKYLKNVCDSEKCWLKQNAYFGKISDELKESFAPLYPTSWLKNKNQWLSSHDIINVMYQYELAYPSFSFIGPSPIDFDKEKVNGNGVCVWEELCNFKLEQMISKGKTQIGIIFNTHPHTKSGEHWISLYVDVPEKQILYFDSGGSEIPKEVKTLVDKIILQGKQQSPKIDFKFDTTTGVHHQLENSECGIYSLFFIINMLEENINKKYLKNNLFRDKYINQFREIYFNRPKG